VAKEIIKVGVKNKGGLLQCSPHIFKLIREKFSVPNPSYQMRRFSPRRYIITPSGAFEIGLWGEIEHYISSMNIPVDIQMSTEFKEQYKPSFKKYEIQNIEGYTYYDHQQNTIREFLDHGRGNGILATSSGKSILIGGLVKTILHYNPTYKFIIIVPNTSLLNQLYNSFVDEFDMNIISRWGDGYTPDWDSSVIIANSQILISDITKTVHLLKNFDVVIVDEVHRLGEKKNQINKVVYNITTPHKFGLTGTLPDNFMAAWNVIGKIGPILYEESSYKIRQKGTASEVEIKIILCQHSTSPDKPDSKEPVAKYNKEREFLYKHVIRNNIIKKIVEKTPKNILILVDLIEHGNILESLMSTVENKQVFFVQGETDTTIRQEITDNMEKLDNIVCIAMSQIFSTGISVNNLPCVIFCSIGKSTVKISQAIGRSMRLHKNKDKAIIYDIADTTEYSQDHLRDRLTLYRKEKYSYTIKPIKI